MSRATQQRHLLPRKPDDRTVLLVMVAGAVAGLAWAGSQRGSLGGGLLVGLVPGAILGGTQHVIGHVLAWRSGGVELAFVMKSAAISFYALTAAGVAVGVLQLVGAVDRVNGLWLFVAAMWVDTIVRKTMESRFA